MNLPVLDFPEDPLKWPLWLEDRLLGNDLGDLIEQLTAVQDNAVSGQTLEEICGEALPHVLQQGLSVLTAEQVRQLLRSPQRLLDLQEEILAEGGPYWLKKIEAVEPDAADRRWQKLQPLLAQSNPAEVVSAAPQTRTGRRWFLVTAGSLAAAALVAAVLWNQEPAAPAPWGWNRPGTFTVDLKGTAYLQHLAKLAEEWENRPRKTSAELERTIAAYRRSCDALIQAPHPQLSEEQRTELKRRCGLWAKAFDAQLEALRNKTKSVDDVRTEADQTVDKLIRILKNDLKDVV